MFFLLAIGGCSPYPPSGELIIPFLAWLVNTDVIPLLCNHFCLLFVYIGLQIMYVGRGVVSPSQQLHSENKGEATAFLV